MAFRMRDHSGGDALGGRHVSRRAMERRASFEPAEIRFTAERRWRSPRTGVEYPVAMRVERGRRRATRSNR